MYNLRVWTWITHFPNDNVKCDHGECKGLGRTKLFFLLIIFSSRDRDKDLCIIISCSHSISSLIKMISFSFISCTGFNYFSCRSRVCTLEATIYSSDSIRSILREVLRTTPWGTWRLLLCSLCSLRRQRNVSLQSSHHRLAYCLALIRPIGSLGHLIWLLLFLFVDLAFNFFSLQHQHLLPG